MTARTWSIHITHLGRPLLANASKKMHPIAETATRGTWRHAVVRAARRQRIPHLDAIEVETWPEYPSRRSLPDTDATAPAVKGSIDGLKAAGVITDDGPDVVRTVTYRAAVVTPGAMAGLHIVIREVAT